MGLLDHLWDDVVAGPQPVRGLGKLRKNASINSRSLPEGAEEHPVTKSITIAKQYNRSLSIDSAGSVPSSPSVSSSPSSPSPLSSTPREKENVWRSVFNPGSNRATGFIGSQKFDNAHPNSTTVYDWLYSDDTRSKRP